MCGAMAVVTGLASTKGSSFDTPKHRTSRTMTTSVVGIGASAGGLEAFSSLLAHLAANTGLAYVFVQHLDPKHHSNLTEILARVSAIAVHQAHDGMEIEPDHLYVI